MSEGSDLIRYDLRIQAHFLAMIRDILAEIVRDGLPGGHYFQITFLTHVPGVGLSSAMLKRFPHEMTIILQHQFGELSVTERYFEVVLFFNGVAERLTIPFSAITGFFDPSVNFALKFEVSEKNFEPASDEKAKDVKAKDVKAKELTPAPDVIKPVRALRGAKSELEEMPPNVPDPSREKPSKEALARKEENVDKNKSAAESDKGKVVSIDAFRRKS